MASRAIPALVGLGVRLAAVPVAVGAAAAAAPWGYEDYTTWHDWARLRTQTSAHLASSYDRTGENSDFSQYEWPPGLIQDERVCTVATLIGPGVVTRFWMPHLTARRGFVVRMYFDGEATPRLDTSSDLLLGGTLGYFTAPLVNTCAGGQVCYDPIPFAAALRIETVNKVISLPWSPDFHYYQYGYTLLPSGTPVPSYTGSLDPGQTAARAAVANMFSQTGQHPAGGSATALCVTTTGSSVPAGQCLILAAVPGPGVVRQISLCMDGARDAELDGLRLQVGYDGDAAPAIDVAISDFFGAGHGRALYCSLPLGTASPAGFYCYWPMPFRRSVAVSLCNTTANPITVASAIVEYEPGPVRADLCYLHASCAASAKTPGQVHHVMLAAAGRGHYVGNLLYVEQNSYNFEMLEGDDLVVADGGAAFGTGLEDAYNGGYYYNWVAVQNDEPEGPCPAAATRPLSGILYVHRETGVSHARADQYRWRIADRVPFQNSIDVRIENRYAVTGAEFRSVAFWYQQPPLCGDPEADGDLDLRDFVGLQRCFAAPPGACAQFDCDEDGDVDLDDYAVFESSLSGPL